MKKEIVYKVSTMIRLDHVAMYVHDLEGMKTFFIRYFSASSNAMYVNPRTGLRSYFLTFPDGGRLEIMNRPEVSSVQGQDLFRGGYTHVAFSVGGKERVDELTQQLKADGYTVLSGPRTTGDGYYESSILGPEGNLIEIISVS